MFLGRLICATLSVTLLVASPALAAGPRTQSTVLVSESFESGTAPSYRVEPIIAAPANGNAYWGPITQRARTGARGLWCAGSNPLAWPSYPQWSSGSAIFAIDARDMHSLGAEFHYTLPSRGDADSTSFAFTWRRLGSPTTELWPSFPMTPAGTWRSAAYDLSVGSNSLVRREGQLAFNWVDRLEGFGSTNFVGEGVTIDDVVVSGWEYGPVRSLAAVQDGADVRLTWSRPYRAKGSSEVEERSIRYDVWRSSGSGGWQLLSGLHRADDVTVEYRDVAPAVGSYVYAVQARGTTPATGHGEARVVPVALTGSPPSAALVSPLGGQAVTSGPLSVVVQAAASPGLSVTAVDVRISSPAGHWSGSAWTTAEQVLSASPAGSGSWAYAWAVPTGMHGTAQISARARDSAGAIGPWTNLSVAVDTRQPPAPIETVFEPIAPPNRYAGSAVSARSAFQSWAGVNHIVIASGEDRAAADPLAAAGLAGAYGAPLLLVSSNRIDSAVASVIQEIAGTASGKVHVHVVGGPASVPDQRMAEIAKMNSKLDVKRVLAAGDRYALAAAIAMRIRDVSGTPQRVLIANGADQSKFFDALSLSPVSAATGYPILLVQADRVPAATTTALNALRPSEVIVGGGPATISEDVVTKQLPNAVRWSGTSRYTTALEIADKAAARGWISPEEIGVAAKLPDALTGGAAVGLGKGALVLTEGMRLTPATAAWLKARGDSAVRVRVFGGDASISPATRAAIHDAVR